MECWVPEEVERKPDEDWTSYEDRLYGLFEEDFVRSSPMYGGKRVFVRKDPRFDGREEAFWHLTCRDYSHKDGRPESRDPDLERCRRIRWPRAVIERHMTCSGDVGNAWGCHGVLVWRGSHRTGKGRPRERVKLFLADESYLVVLESRSDYYLLITAYHVEEEYSLRSIRREAERKGATWTCP